MINYAHWFSKEDARDFTVEEKIANREDLSEEDRKYKAVKFKNYEVQKHLPFLNRVFHLHGDDVPEGLSGSEYIIAPFPFDAGGNLKDEWDIETCILAFNEGWIDGFIVKNSFSAHFQAISPTASYYGIILVDLEKRQLLHDTVKEKFKLWLDWFDKSDLWFGIKKHTWFSSSIRGICNSKTWDEHLKSCEDIIRNDCAERNNTDAKKKDEDEEAEVNLPFEKRVEALAFMTWYDEFDTWNIHGQKIGAHQSYETIDMVMKIVNKLKDCSKYYHGFKDVYWYPFIVNFKLRDEIERYQMHQKRKAKFEESSARIKAIAESLS